MISPSSTVEARPAYVMNSREASPSPPLGPHTNVVASPGLNSTTPSRSLPIRSFGPGRSCRIATWRPARPAASRTRRAVSACSSALPWEKFRRATSIPASIMRGKTSGSRDAGPIVATIFVRRSMGPRTVSTRRQEAGDGADGARAGVEDDDAVGTHVEGRLAVAAGGRELVAPAAEGCARRVPLVGVRGGRHRQPGVVGEQREHAVDVVVGEGLGEADGELGLVR